MSHSEKPTNLHDPDSEDSISDSGFEKLRLELHSTSQSLPAATQQEGSDKHKRPGSSASLTPQNERQLCSSSTSVSVVQREPFIGGGASCSHHASDLTVLNQTDIGRLVEIKSTVDQMSLVRRDLETRHILDEFEIPKKRRSHDLSHQKGGSEGQSFSSTQSQLICEFDAVIPKENVDDHNIRRLPAELHLHPEKWVKPEMLCRRLKDQESQVSDSLPVAYVENSDDEFGKPSQSVQVNIQSTTTCRSTSRQATCSQTAKGKDNLDLPPPPSYSQCCGMELNQSQAPLFRQNEAPGCHGETVARRQYDRVGGVEGGDTLAQQKPPGPQNIARNQSDGQCEVLVLQEQGGARSQNSESNGDHHLLAFLSCLLFWPIGLLAIYYANMANALKSEGYLQQSFYYSKRALILSLTAIAIGTVMYFVFYMRHKLHM